jgi:cyclic pyranopterin phosphate synthase
LKADSFQRDSVGEMKTIVKDAFGRVHDYLRISLTDNCNLRCFYCIPNDDHQFTPTSLLMNAREIEGLATLFVGAGVSKIRLTGGEPLVRQDASEIILALSKLPVELTLTTNGTRVHSSIDVFKEAGIRSVNVSLDTLKPDKFTFLTRRKEFEKVYNNIQLLLSHNFHVKVNVVVMKGINEDEINDFIEWTKETPVHVRFIEFMPFAGNRWTDNQVVTKKEILQLASLKYNFVALQNGQHDTAKAFQVEGHVGTFGVISTMSEHFCGSCNRMRLTADGKLKNCLFSKTETDLLTPFRNGSDVLGLIKETIMSKHRQLGGQLPTDFAGLLADSLQNRSMIKIGG